MKIKQTIIKALVNECSMTEKEAEERVHYYDGFEIFDEVLCDDEFDEGLCEFLVEDLSQGKHSYDMYISPLGEVFHIALCFYGEPAVTAVEDAIAHYEKSSVSEELIIENEIESKEDVLMLCYNSSGDLQKDLNRVFDLLKSLECKQLLDTVLGNANN